jgi:hypothetical protein
MITQKASARARPLDYFMLFEPHPDGPVLGTYAGHPIAETVIDGYGIRYIFAGVAPRLRSGGYDSEACCRANGWSSRAWSIGRDLHRQIIP